MQRSPDASNAQPALRNLTPSDKFCFMIAISSYFYLLEVTAQKHVPVNHSLRGGTTVRPEPFTVFTLVVFGREHVTFNNLLCFYFEIPHHNAMVHVDYARELHDSTDVVHRGFNQIKYLDGPAAI